MKPSKIISLAVAIVFVAVMVNGVIVSAASGSAKVTYLKGKAYKSRKRTGPWRSIRRNYTVTEGYYVKTAAGSRLELTLPDRSKIRIAPNSMLYLSRARFRKRTRDYEVRVERGRVYTRATSSRNKRDKYIVRSGGAVAGIRGTSFDTVLMPDNSTRIKCYEGKVWVATWADYAQRILQEKQEIPVDKALERNEVPGPEEVTVEEWIKIAGAMMSITVGADGTVQDPEPIVEGDSDDWEEWNQERDKLK